MCYKLILKTITFIYDLKGRRLSKKIEVKNKKPKSFHYFYLHDTEIGCLDEYGNIVELKIPSDPNHPEASTSVAIELQRATYVPLYDLQGNVICLLDHQKRQVCESYRYSAFGEQTIYDEKGILISKPVTGNPWRYRGQRSDDESGLIYFGLRYYDPEIGRWISPDPAGSIDGPNLYRFTRNNPLTYVDYFGLASEINENQNKEFNKYFYGEYEPYCHCEEHRTCKRGGDFQNALFSSTPQNTNLPFQICSTPFEVGSIERDDVGIGFVNGIRATFAETHNVTSHLSKYAQGLKIQGIYNATHSGSIDVVECILAQCGIPTPPVLLLQSQWIHFIATHRPNAKFLQISYSGGAIPVFNALRASPPALRDKIISLAIAPGAIIPPTLCHRAGNYASKHDLVPLMDIVGQMRYGKNLIYLDPHPEAPLFDHGFDSPTFQNVIEAEILDYIKTYGEEK